MHTGALRYLYNPVSNTAYTWRVYFDALPSGIGNYTVTPVDITTQDDVVAAARDIGVSPASTAALNVSLTSFTADVARGTAAYTTAMLASPVKRALAEAEFPKIRMQQKRI
jgi:hypothetical protein